MQDRTESSIVLLIAVVVGIPVVLPQLIPVGFGYFWQLGLILLWGISVYWAFSLSRLLSARLYRNQAFGVGLVAAAWMSFNYSFRSPSLLVPNIAYPLVLSITFFWVDSSVLASRKSDPLYRNTLHWRELRWVLWPALLGGSLVWLAGLVLDPVGFLLVLPNGVSLSGSPVANGVLLGMFLIVAIFGPVYLLVTALRSRDDTLRRHLRWFGFFVASFFFFAFLGGLAHDSQFFGAGYVIGTYCLYRSAKSLAPLNRLPVG